MRIYFLAFLLFLCIPLSLFTQSVYLTIDDGPSSNTLKLVSYLVSKKIPAIFYCCGKNIEKYKKSVVLAIKEGFIIGNHSYSHPHFSEITLEECFEEILKTEQLIDECYTLAKKKRPAKVMRFPYGDRGAGNSGREIRIGKSSCKFPVTKEQQNNIDLLQAFFKKHKFTRPDFKSLQDTEIDSMWSLHTIDYFEACLDKEAASLELFKKTYYSSAEYIVLLVHDKSFNYDLLKERLDFLCEEKVMFLLPNFSS